MMDGLLKEDGKSIADYDYNLNVTKKVVEGSHALGVTVEGELGLPRFARNVKATRRTDTAPRAR
jgi:fructose/tagatose bisphosphate aldolase